MSRQIDGFLSDAGSKFADAQRYESSSRHAAAVQAAQEAMELYAKASFLLLDQQYPRKHDFSEDEFLATLNRLPESMSFLRFPRLYLLHRFWAHFYTTAKYGFEKLEAPPADLFGFEEAGLAIKHAREWQDAAIRLRNALAQSEAAGEP